MKKIATIISALCLAANTYAAGFVAPTTTINSAMMEVKNNKLEYNVNYSANCSATITAYLYIKEKGIEEKRIILEEIAQEGQRISLTETNNLDNSIIEFLRRGINNSGIEGKICAQPYGGYEKSCSEQFKVETDIVPNIQEYFKKRKIERGEEKQRSPQAQHDTSTKNIQNISSSSEKPQKTSMQFYIEGAGIRSTHMAYPIWRGSIDAGFFFPDKYWGLSMTWIGSGRIVLPPNSRYNPDKEYGLELENFPHLLGNLEIGSVFRVYAGIGSETKNREKAYKVIEVNDGEHNKYERKGEIEAPWKRNLSWQIGAKFGGGPRTVLYIIDFSYINLSTTDTFKFGMGLGVNF